MTEAIRIEFTMTFRQYLAFNWQVLFRRIRWLILVAIVLLVCFALAPVLPVEGNPSIMERYRDSVRLLIVPGIVFVVFPLAQYFSASRQWRTAPELRQHRVYEFSESGLSWAGETFRGSTSWEHVVRAATAGTIVVLLGRQQQGHIIPLEAIRRSGQAEAWFSLVREKVPDCRRL